MLDLLIKSNESWDPVKEEFIPGREIHISLEHSLIAISKWEAKWHKPFLNVNNNLKKTSEEIIDYIKCMTISPKVPDDVYNHLSDDNINDIQRYLENPMTATWFSEDPNRPVKHNREQITSELIYYWMIELGIPIEFQKWHINRLLTLIKVCNVKNSKPRKMSNRELLARNAALNAQRRARLNTRG